MRLLDRLRVGRPFVRFLITIFMLLILLYLLNGMLPGLFDYYNIAIDRPVVGILKISHIIVGFALYILWVLYDGELI